MLIELAHFSLILALCVAVALGCYGSFVRSGPASASYLRLGSLVLTALVLFSFLLLIHAFLTDDFSVRYVAGNSRRDMHPFFKLGATWGGHEGSLLLWVLLLCCWQLALSLLPGKVQQPVHGLATGLFGLIITGFLLFVLLTSNPFERLLPAPMDGGDLNPLLQDAGLVLHPPLLYLGYVGFAPIFVLTMAALLRGKVDAHWARYLRPWTLLAWCFLTLGILLGSMWAYYELGWGGWWFWDPVENASLMPWLSATALLHCLAVVEKRGTFKHWSVLLAIATFSMSVLGTFLVRSGVLTSVHAFASDPARGIFVLTFLALISGFALLVYVQKWPKLEPATRNAMQYRDLFLLINTILLVTVCLTVLIGTLFPLLTDVLKLGKFSVGAPYFNTVLTPVWLLLLVVLALTFLMQRKSDTWKSIRPAAWLTFALAAVAGCLMPLWFSGSWKWGVAAALTLAWWVVIVSVRDMIRRFRSPAARGARPPASFFGMHLAHIGAAVFTMGATVVSHYDITADVLMHPRQPVQVGDYEVVFQQLEGKSLPNFQSLIGHFVILEDGKPVGRMKGEKRKYISSDSPMTEAAISRGFREDIYLSMGELRGANPAQDPWTVRIQIKPLMNWVWAGCILMALGGLMSSLDKRYRKKQVLHA